MFRSKNLKNKRGQSLVELALLLPLLLLILMGIFEFGRVFNAYLITNHAAREGARFAVVGSDDLQVISRIRDSIFYLDPTKMTVNISPGESSRTRGSSVTVNLQYDIDIIVPIIESIVPNPLTLESKTVMRVE